MKWQTFDNTSSKALSQARAPTQSSMEEVTETSMVANPPPISASETSTTTPTSFASHSSCPNCQFTLQARHQSLTFCPDCSFPIRILEGKYRLDKALAEGGFGVVYIASQAQSSAPCVVKVIRPEVFELPGMEARFRREIRVTKQIAHENEHIINIFDHGEEKDIGCYYVMELLQGESLEEYLYKNKAMSFQQVFHIFAQMCDALSLAHAKGIIHRDLKPDNIFLIEKEGDPCFVKILDFGIAKPLDGTVNVGLTKGALGTPAYMSPEQCTNSTISAATDIYALGIILYELLTRTLPFEDSAMASLLLKHLTEVPESLLERRPDLHFPKMLDQALQIALAKKPEARFHSVQEFWTALAPYSHLEGFATVLPRDAAKEKELAPTRQPCEADRAFAPTGTFHSPDVSLSDSLSATVVGEKVSGPHRPVTIQRTSSSQLPLFALLGLLLLALSVGGVYTFKDKFFSNSKKPPYTRQNRPHKAKVVLLSHRKPSKPERKIATTPRVVPTLPKEQEPVIDDTKVEPRKRIRRRLRRRKRTQKKKARSKVIPMGIAGRKCGVNPPGKVKIWGQFKRTGIKVKFTFSGCGSCRVRRRRRGYCLTLPKSRKSISVRIKASGFQSCAHRISTSSQYVRWTFKVEEPDDLVDENYNCLRVLR